MLRIYLNYIYFLIDKTEKVCYVVYRIIDLNKGLLLSSENI